MMQSSRAAGQVSNRRDQGLPCESAADAPGTAGSVGRRRVGQRQTIRALPSVVGVVEMPAAVADHHLGELLIPAEMNPQGSGLGILGADLEVLPHLQSPQRLPALQRRSAPPCPWGDDRSMASLPKNYADRAYFPAWMLQHRVKMLPMICSGLVGCASSGALHPAVSACAQSQLVQTIACRFEPQVAESACR